MTESPERRELRFDNLDQVVAEVEQLASGQVKTTGNHSFGQIIEHLARTHDLCTGKLVGPKPPWFMRLMIPLMKGSMLKDKPLKPGFNLPPAAENFFWPAGEVDVQQAIDHLKQSVENYQTKGALPKHPIFGKITKAQNLNLNCRHAAMHLSFAHPA